MSRRKRQTSIPVERWCCQQHVFERFNDTLGLMISAVSDLTVDLEAELEQALNSEQQAFKKSKVKADVENSIEARADGLNLCWIRADGDRVVSDRCVAGLLQNICICVWALSSFSLVG